MASLYDSDSDDELLEVVVIALLATAQKEKMERSCWVRPWISRRGKLWVYSALMSELMKEDAKSFSNFIRMGKDSFEDLQKKVSPLLMKSDTPMRNAIPVGDKLAITLRFLATSDSYQSLEFLYRIPKNAISEFVPLVYQAIYDSLKDGFLKAPSSEEEWGVIMKDFHTATGP